ncbi:MAG: amidophosphoribosyltransferase, partial [Candidatus Pacebacteria bacterium]|nr:amidophosphoribosyltransferase [Candidatus Paceibacterota bacterium]
MTHQNGHSSSEKNLDIIDSPDDHFQDECAVFGIFGTPDAAAHTALGLHALQHRGQSATGIVTFDNSTAQFYTHRGMGRVSANYHDPSVMEGLKGSSAIGHNRYATTGENSLRNVQPLEADLDLGHVAIAHNGNIVNYPKLRSKLQKIGQIFHTSSDTEIVLQLMAKSLKENLIEKLNDALAEIVGAYAFVALVNDSMIGIRDPNGLRPLVLGKLGEAWVLASETCAFDIIGAEFIREIEAGEMVVIDQFGIKSHRHHPKTNVFNCVFEYVYFSRPDSISDGVSFYERRKHIGMELARESHVEADIVIPVPDSGVPAALGYAAASKIPFELGIIRNHYVGRTFIEPTAQIRHLGVRLKHNAIPTIIKGKRVILVDDSIVRGTTAKKIVRMILDAGATEVHLRIASPATKSTCHYGVDTPDEEELLANNYDHSGMVNYLGCTTLAFISIEALYNSVSTTQNLLHGSTTQQGDTPGYCFACFNKRYPIEIPAKADIRKFPDNR